MEASIAKRINFLKERIRITQVMDHFGHRWHEYGNMLCPFHEEKNPSSRLYREQDTFWCWACSPNHGVDVVEYVVLALDLEAEVPNTVENPHGLATLKGIEYLERTFNIAFENEPWQARLDNALRRQTARQDSERFWNSQHIELLISMLSVNSSDKWTRYADLIRLLTRIRFLPPDQQLRSWRQARTALARG